MLIILVLALIFFELRQEVAKKFPADFNTTSASGDFLTGFCVKRCNTKIGPFFNDAIKFLIILVIGQSGLPKLHITPHALKYADFSNFLKKVGITSQREIEKAVATGIESGTLQGNETLPVQITLRLGSVDLELAIDGEIRLA